MPQQETGTEYNDISRGTTITPAYWKAKVEGGEMSSSMRSRKSPTTPKMASTSFTSRRPLQKYYCNGVLNSLQPPHGRPSHALYENTPKWVCSKSNFIFPKSNFTIQRSYPPVLQETRGYDSPINWGEIFYRARFALRKFTGLPL